MRFFRVVINKIGIYEDVVSEQEYKNIFDMIDLEDDSFNKDTYIPGSSGQSKLLKALKSYISD